MEKLKLVYNSVRTVIPDGELYLVGGAVRDAVLELEPHDFDFCTNLSPDDIVERVKKAGRKPYMTGARFGTIGFKAPIYYQETVVDGGTTQIVDRERFEYVEVTTYRGEKYTKGSRKPEVVFIEKLDEDLSRRDFKINAMAYDGTNIIDPFGGQLDVLRKQVTAVGVPKERFNDDPLRMLRLVRFASQLGYTMEANTFGKARQLAPRILDVSKERWVQEIDKVFEKDIELYPFFKNLYEIGLFKYMLPEVHLAWEKGFYPMWWINAPQVYHNAKMTPDQKWKFLLGEIAKPYCVQKVKSTGAGFNSTDYELKFSNEELIKKELLIGICHRLKFSNERKDCVLGVDKHK